MLSFASGAKPGSVAQHTGVNHFNRYVTQRAGAAVVGGGAPPGSVDPVSAAVRRDAARVDGRVTGAATQSSVQLLSMDPECVDWPVHGAELLDFCRYLYDVVGVSPTSVNTYLFQVQRHLRLVGRAVDAERPPLLKALMQRMLAMPRASLFKEPCTRELMTAVALDASAAMGVRTAAVLAWFLTLRLGSVTLQSVSEYDPVFCVRRCDVEVDPEGRFAKFTLRKGKNDSHNRGGARFLMAASPQAGFCPLQFLRTYLESTQQFPVDEPLLRHPDGRHVVRAHVVALLKRHAAALGMDSAHISGHSLRIGSGTALAAGGVDVESVMLWGGWSTEQGCLRYLRLTSGQAFRISDILSLDGGGLRARADSVPDWRQGSASMVLSSRVRL